MLLRIHPLLQNLLNLLLGAVCFLALPLAPAIAAPEPLPEVTVIVDGSRKPGQQPATLAGKLLLTEALAPCGRWAYMESEGAPTVPEITGLEGVQAAVVSRTGRAGLLVRCPGDTPTRVRVETYLPAGLWRGEAALIATEALGGEVRQSDARCWRMESVLRTNHGRTVKTLTVPAGQVLALRWTETGTAAYSALRAARTVVRGSENEILAGRVLGALQTVEQSLEAIPSLVEKADREKICRKVHTALLAVGKAQALWQNGLDTGPGYSDVAFDGLTNALSEISCAAYNLVPRQVSIVTRDGKPAVTVTVTNAGNRTVPLIALGLSEAGEEGAMASSDLSVHRSLRPGASVTARFRVPDAHAARGIIQFITRMGTAVIAACPTMP